MTQKELTERYGNKPPIAVYADSNWGGLELLDVEHGIDEYAICRWNYGTPGKIHRVKIQYTKSESVPYIRIDGYSISFNNLMRV
jgi:hypothetical protein